MGKIDPGGWRNDLHQVVFNLFRCVVLGETKSVAQSADVGVDDNALGFPVSDAKNNVSGFATTTGKLD